MSTEREYLPRSSPKWVLPVWAIGASVSLIVGALSRCEFLGWWNALIVVHMGTNGIRNEGSIIPLHLCRSIPGILGVCSLVAIWISNRKVRGAVLTLTSCIALILCYIEVYLKGTERKAIATWIEIMVAAALIAAGNRTMLHVPDRRFPRILAGMGGAKLFLSFLTPGDDHIQRSILSEIATDVSFGVKWDTSLFATMLLVYAILGTLCPFSRGTPRVRCRAVTLLGYVLLITFPIVLYKQWVSMTGGGAEPYSSYHFAFLVKFWLLGTGYTTLLAVGLASWVEAVLIQEVVDTV